MQLQWNHAERHCYYCNQFGHLAWRCPKKSVKINKIEAAKALVVPGKVSNQHTDLMIDTGAAMSMVPAKLISRDDYTGHYRHVRGAVGGVAIDVKGDTTMMTVLVTAEDTQPLLGTDHPVFMKILRDTNQTTWCQGSLGRYPLSQKS